MDGHDRMLAAFLAGDLDPARARRWDEHLLECERCWQAVREDRAGREAAALLRQPVPTGLADRVAFAVEVTAATGGAERRQARPGSRARRRARPGGRLRWWLAGVGTLAVGAAVTLVAVLIPGGRETGSVPAAVAVVARYAQAVPSPDGEWPPSPGRQAAPVEVGRAVMLTAGGQRIVVRTWRLGGTEVVAAVSGEPFSMPMGAQAVPGGGMGWSARLGKLSLYCVNGRTSELVAAPVPGTELAALAAQLPLA
jgi:anti-sigma factor RsiW